jgi:type VI secretion system Hcp family effector
MSYCIQQGGEWEDGDRLAGRITSFSDLALVKEMDSSSPSLSQACAIKEQFPKAEISLAAPTKKPKKSKETYLKVTLENVIITSVAIGFRSDEPRPTETVTLSFKKATWEWGTAKGGYDLRQNAKA